MNRESFVEQAFGPRGRGSKEEWAEEESPAVFPLLPPSFSAGVGNNTESNHIAQRRRKEMKEDPPPRKEEESRKFSQSRTFLQPGPSRPLQREKEGKVATFDRLPSHKSSFSPFLCSQQAAKDEGEGDVTTTTDCRPRGAFVIKGERRKNYRYCGRRIEALPAAAERDEGRRAFSSSSSPFGFCHAYYFPFVRLFPPLCTHVMYKSRQRRRKAFCFLPSSSPSPQEIFLAVLTSCDTGKREKTLLVRMHSLCSELHFLGNSPCDSIGVDNPPRKRRFDSFPLLPSSRLFGFSRLPKKERPSPSLLRHFRFWQRPLLSLPLGHTNIVWHRLRLGAKSG